MASRTALKILNAAVFFLFFGSNLYSSLGGPATGYYSLKETYITPAPETFWIWTLINLLFFGFVVLQFFDPATHPTLDLIGWRFVAIGILQSLWIHLSVRHHYVLAFIFSLIVASVVSHVYWDLRSCASRSKPECFLIHLPFSLLHAYLVFLLVLSAFTAFGVDKAVHPAGPLTQVLVVLALFALTCIGFGYAFHSDQGDIAGAFVIALDLAGVFARQYKPDSIHWAAFAAFLVTLLAATKAVYYTVRGRRILLVDSERAPLIG